MNISKNNYVASLYCKTYSGQHIILKTFRPVQELDFRTNTFKSKNRTGQFSFVLKKKKTTIWNKSIP